MPLLVATATAHPLTAWLILAAAGLLTVAVYAGSCWLWPFAHCRKCQGAGKFSRDDRKVFRLCRRCDGSGRRLRIGRRVWNYLSARRKAAQ